MLIFGLGMKDNNETKQLSDNVYRDDPELRQRVNLRVGMSDSDGIKGMVTGLEPARHFMSTQDLRKAVHVIVSTNKTESSVTFHEDLKVGIDTGLERRINAGGELSHPQIAPTSSQLQRAGRMGRCSPGLLISLVSQETYDELLASEEKHAERQTPPVAEVFNQIRENPILVEPFMPSPAIFGPQVKILDGWELMRKKEGGKDGE